MLYLIAIFLPWLALLLAGKPFQALVSLGLTLLSAIGLLFFLLPGLLLWLLAVAHAFAVIGNARADKRARSIIAAVRDGQKAPAG